MHVTIPAVVDGKCSSWVTLCKAVEQILNLQYDTCTCKCVLYDCTKTCRKLVAFRL